MDDRLGLTVTHSDGQITRWGPDEANGEDIPGDLTFSTQIPGGFKDLTCSLLRRVDVDYVDQGLYDNVRVYGPGNRTVWEGRMAQFPRSHGDGFQIVPGAIGHSALLADNPTFREIYVGRDFSNWGQASVQRRLNLVGTYTVGDPAVTPDSTTGQQSLATAFTGAWTNTSRPNVEAWYDARGISLGSLYYAWKKNANVANADANWGWQAFLSTTDTGSSLNASGNLRAAGPGTGTVSASGAAKPFALLQHVYDAGPGGADNTEYAIYWTCLAVYGTHGLTKQGSESATSAKGFFASDVIQNIVTRSAPLLSIGEITATTYVIPDMAFLDPISGEDAIKQANEYHGYDWGVYDNKKFFYRAPDPTRLTWQARLSTGARLDFEGETAEQVFNGAYVTYTDPLGMKKTVGPTWSTAQATSSTLEDSNPANPLNAWGLKRPLMVDVPFVTDLAGATAIGVVALGLQALPQRRGTLTMTGKVTHPTEGEVPVWRVRAGDYVSISDHPADVPRKIIATTYTHETRTISCSLDNTPHALDAIFARVAVGAIGVL